MNRSVGSGERRGVLFPLFDGVQSLTFSGPADVFCAANAATEPDPASGTASGYEVLTASRGGAAVRTSSGLRVVPDLAFEDVTDVHTVILPGTEGIPVLDEETVAAIGVLAGRARRVASVCTGAFLLAATGLLHGRRAATHWEHAEELRRRHPAVEVHVRDTVVRDGPVTTAGGIASGVDLALALVEEDMGREAAHTVARYLVTHMRVPGGQAQFADLHAPQARNAALREVQRRVLAHPEADLTVRSLSRHAGLSERHLSRLFREQTGMSARVYVERARVAVASRLLTETLRSAETVAEEAGFGTAATMGHAFHRVLGISPLDQRERFS
ncbi:helix-turn-helix domain-containing protein [Streptomyces sp. S3(2020)]|uniref:GlxA family transcriptional regulator n=1 Tax=Streptomyces sp. S3(2020) TaxID=2732044 RepID=UPI001487DD2D|nr:DJ-1/PfpI family protein [Streptomyces sp. S3(2020)]NNN31130.1 helix-turn-helix domain-containing protein [Streptomyces sp. S3(2020)]